MTVAELITKLQTLPQDARVVVGDPGGYFEETEVGEPWTWHRVGLCVEIRGK